MSLPGLNTDPEDNGASDGVVGIDYGWNNKLGKVIKDTSLTTSLIEGIQGIRDLDVYRQPGSGLQPVRVVQSGLRDCDLFVHSE